MSSTTARPTLAKIDGYTIAGKTGTASKLIDGRYSSENNASFAGFVPSRNPEVTIVVVIDAPHLNGSSGGVVAAPIFQRIAETTLRHLGIGPTINPEPPVLVERRDAANVRTSAPNPGATDHQPRGRRRRSRDRPRPAGIERS